MICIGIPVCRPLYKQVLSRYTTHSTGYQKQGAGPRYGLRTFGGGTMPGAPKRSGADSESNNKSQAGEGDGSSFRNVKLGINGPFTHTSAVAGRVELGDNHSEEEILDETYRAQRRKMSDPERGDAAIQITETWRVTRS